MLTMNSIDSFVAHLTTMGAAENTVRGYRTNLVGAVEYAGSTGDWENVEAVLAQYLTAFRTKLAPKTTESRLGCFRSWAKWAGAPHGFLADYRPPKPGQQQPHPIPEGIAGVLAMIKSTHNPKHKALCVLTGLMGLRVHEAIAVEAFHFDLSGMTLTVRGKGDKTRYVPVSPTAWGLLEKRYHRAIADREPLVPLTNHGARAAISRHARNAGLSRHVSSHDMRATFATAAYDKTKDLRAVQELLGHASPVTTTVYTGVSQAAMRSAAEVA